MMKEMFLKNANNGSFALHSPETPRHWVNYLWSKSGYCAQFNQIGSGKSYFIDDKANMCAINPENAKYIYLRNDESGEYWLACGGSGANSLDQYCCEHNKNFTKISSTKNNITFECTYTVPIDGSNEIWDIHLTNHAQTSCKLSVFVLTSFALEGFAYPRYYEMYRSATTSFEKNLNGVFCETKHPFAPHKKYNGYIASTQPVFGFDGNLATFLGSENIVTRADDSQAGQYICPRVVVQNRDCTNSCATNFMLGGVLQHKIELSAQSKWHTTVSLGVSDCLEDACYEMEKLQNPNTLIQTMHDSDAYYQSLYQNLTLDIPDERLNFIYQHWLNKQVDFCIVGKKGVRDNLQISAALLNYRTEKACAEILEVLRHQFSDGHAVLTWYPYDDTRYSDQPFWIGWAVCRLIKETGDLSLLQTMVPYQDHGEGSVLEHVEKGIERLYQDRGKHGLCRIFFADWNDALNITTDEQAESVMLSAQFALLLQEMRTLYQCMGDNANAENCQTWYREIAQAINDNAWDGQWYIRATCQDRPIGSQNSEGSKIYLNAQTWAVLANVVPKDRLPLVLDSIQTMEHPFGYPLNIPAYPNYNADVGRMSGMLPGLYENGGVYCHATGFKIMMDCMLGRGDDALRALQKIAPDSEQNPSLCSGAEPYVFTNCFSIHQNYYGKSYQSWTTGTSAWCLMAMYEGILGLQAQYEGLSIAPAFPSTWEYAQASRVFRGCHYHIEYENPQKKCSSLCTITVDGVLIDGNILPLFHDEQVHAIKVTML